MDTTLQKKKLIQGWHRVRSNETAGPASCQNSQKNPNKTKQARHHHELQGVQSISEREWRQKDSPRWQFGHEETTDLMFRNSVNIFIPMDMLAFESISEALSTRSWVFSKTEIFFSVFKRTLRPHVAFSNRI